MFSLNEVDADGAIAESAHEATESLNGDTRLGFLKKAGLTGGAVVGGGAVLSALVPGAALASNHKLSRPDAKLFGTGDIGILRYALTLEYLESAFYNEATVRQARTGFIKDPQTQVFLRAVTGDENLHVAALRKTLRALGRKPQNSPKFNFHGDTGNEAAFVKAAYTFENEGVHAYSGQAFNIKSADILAAALSIVTIEARHASVIGLIRYNNDKGITPDGAFDTPFGGDRVLKDVLSLKYIVSL